MASAHALLSSSLSAASSSSSVEAGRQLLTGRPLPSIPSCGSLLQPTNRSTSFVVRAAATPPVKQGADRQLWFASKQSLSYLDGSYVKGVLTS